MKAFGVTQNGTYRTSLRVQETMLPVIAQSMHDNGYGVRQRSKWICESLEKLVSSEDYWHLISEAFMDQGASSQIPVTLDHDTNKRLDEATKTYKKEYGVSEIDQSAILRAAITYRLLNEGGGLVDI